MIARAESSPATARRTAVVEPLCRRIAVLMPCHQEPPTLGLAMQARRQVAELLLVDDGAGPESSARIAAIARAADGAYLRLPRRRGKGHAVAAGIERLLSRPDPPVAVVVVDCDGQHPPDRIPAFLDAGRHAELVIGDRFGDLARMPWHRRIGNLAASTALRVRTGVPVRDTQCGMRLLRGRALQAMRTGSGGYEWETRHLRWCLEAGIPVSWVPIPAIYGDESSSFRPFRDSIRVLRATVV